ncbi:MAG: sulfatase [Kordiimonadaceae bacterium]|jgi:arylsulfatase A-like enzyme|nr:sulfatase [Kordiimonadaceae bacterium]MBT6031895.1 sulfatase [Kordiimonadaceae bacterium]MBT7582492.1 sulfatase [Kordiimonadaceae bacterium]
MLIKNLKFIVISLLSLFMIPLSLHAENNKWNFLIIVVDDLGQMDISPNNPDTYYQTPNLQKLATQSVRFSQNYSASPVCSPARLALMTGKNPARLNATDWFRLEEGQGRSETYKWAKDIHHMPSEEVTLAEALKPAGYKSAFLGKWHLGHDEKYWPEHQGFDINIGGYWSGSPRGQNESKGSGYFAPYNNPRLADKNDGEYLTERLSSEAMNLLEGYSKSEDPFLMVLSFYTVHTPLNAPKETISKYDANNLKSIFTQEEQIWPTEEIRAVRQNQTHSTYAAMVEHMDLNIGRVLKQLEKTGLDDNTVVFFTSDNGGLSSAEGSPTSNLPFRGGKGWIYEGGIRVPFMVRWPNVGKTDYTNPAAVTGLDIFPTIMEIAGADKSNIDGNSLVSKIKGEIESTEQPLYWHYPHYSNQGGMPASAIRLGDYKLIQRLEDGRHHLYDLSKDPDELHDLANEMPEKVEQLRSMLFSWYKEVDAEFLREKDGNTPWEPEL